MSTGNVCDLRHRHLPIRRPRLRYQSALEAPLGIDIELNEIPHSELKKRVEAIVRECIGDQQQNVDWKVWIYSTGVYQRVVVKGPTQIRERIFLGKDEQLIEPLRDWLKLYPFK